MKGTFEDLITDYLQQVENCLVLFEAKFERRDLIRAWREGVIPLTGELADGLEYNMHGYGCAVEYPDYDVDFDFAAPDKVGFDAWRLWRFANQFPERYLDYQELSAVEAAVDAIVTDGVAARVADAYPGEANGNLFLLTPQD